MDAALRFYARVTSDLIAILDREGRIQHVNDLAERVLGRTPAQCAGVALFDLVHPQDREASREAFSRWVAGTAPLLMENRTCGVADVVNHISWTMAPGAGALIFAHGRDVTSQVLSEERVRQSDLRLRAVLVGMLDPLLTIDSHGKVLEANRSVQEVFGYRPEELVGGNISVLMPEPHRSQHDGYLERYRRTGNTWILNTTRRFDVRRKDGATIQVELSVSRVDVPGDPEPVFVGSFRDITARALMEQALAENEARMRAIFDQEFQFVGLLARDGTLLEINRSALESIGRAREEVIGRPFWDTPWWSALPEMRERVKHAITSAARGEFVRFEVEHVDRGRHSVWTDFSIKAVRDAHGEVQFLLPEGRDITLLKVSHARELAIQEALAAIGESASVLAHEIKNPLTAVNLALRAVADKLGEDHRTVLEDLAMRLQKLERTMRRTLSFTRPLALERSACALPALVAEVRDTLASELARASVELEIVSPPDLPEIQADHGLLEEVLINLVRNSCEALKNGGHVCVSLALDGKDHLRIEVEDDGPGIAPSLRGELFKPFVTSRVGGTGLGLAIARKIVRDHGGEIGAEDGQRGGACFWIRLPIGRTRPSAYARRAE